MPAIYPFARIDKSMESDCAAYAECAGGNPVAARFRIGRTGEHVAEASNNEWDEGPPRAGKHPNERSLREERVSP